MTYKFPQFNIEIIDPIVNIEFNTIGDKALDKLLSVDVVLTTSTATFGVRAEDMPYVDTWEDTDVPGMVYTWITQYEV